MAVSFAAAPGCSSSSLATCACDGPHHDGAADASNLLVAAGQRPELRRADEVESMR